MGLGAQGEDIIPIWGQLEFRFPITRREGSTRMDVLEAKEVKNEGIGCAEFNCSHSQYCSAKFCSFTKKKKKVD